MSSLVRSAHRRTRPRSHPHATATHPQRSRRCRFRETSTVLKSNFQRQCPRKNFPAGTKRPLGEAVRKLSLQLAQVRPPEIPAQVRGPENFHCTGPTDRILSLPTEYFPSMYVQVGSLKELPIREDPFCLLISRLFNTLDCVWDQQPIRPARSRSGRSSL